MSRDGGGTRTSKFQGSLESQGYLEKGRSRQLGRQPGWPASRCPPRAAHGAAAAMPRHRASAYFSSRLRSDTTEPGCCLRSAVCPAVPSWSVPSGPFPHQTAGKTRNGLSSSQLSTASQRLTTPSALQDDMVLEIDNVLKEVGGGAHATRAQLTFDEVRSLWTHLSKFIEWAVLAGKVRPPAYTPREVFPSVCFGSPSLAWFGRLLMSRARPQCVELTGFMTISAGHCALDKKFCLNCVPLIKPPRDVPQGTLV